MSDSSFLSAERVARGGPAGFTRALERLLPLLGFSQVVNIDGSGDQGGDLLTKFGREQVALQVKWRQDPVRGSVGDDAVDEVSNAIDAYGAASGIVVTNGRFTKSARGRIDAYGKVSRQIKAWDGRDLAKLYRKAAMIAAQVELRPYQVEAVQASLESLRDPEKRRALVYLATGLGKTVVAGSIAADWLDRDPSAKILVIAHGGPLVDQLEKSMWPFIPKDIPTQMIGQGEHRDDLSGVTFAVLPTAHDYVERGYRPDLVIVDEVHHVGETGFYAHIIEMLDGVPRLGVTATPWRGDRFDIEVMFGEPVVRMSIADGIRRGYLAQVDYQLLADDIDWEFVKEASAHSYTIKDLNRRLFIPERDEAIIERLTKVWNSTRTPRGMVFCQTIEHAERFAERLREYSAWRGVETIHNGMTKRERQQRLVQFRAGQTELLVSVDLLNEGIDVPDVNIIVFARVTHSRRIFIQQLGRGLRLRTGKERVAVLDCVSDLRRIAEVSAFRAQVEASETEVLSINRSSFDFADQGVRSLIEQWVADIGDLATATDQVRLEFPPTSDDPGVATRGFN
ncbi:restriction endonuclease subunit R [Tsukamurella pulmonis]|uniref:Helicase conserved C-terminal domain-containing protein n=1 Tax=Tsukamurella pulmonis TaxID=47312 RepID=A0A1H1DQE3_9ACTN|nr:DEAD/DEAH box helicase family protein [Tsukamurella pulmonis]KXO92243.1 restriction endonuclease subunit R [Tsukamurella pulmonis]SDQ78590.1 Helicase conserved C-terminal domain-containing protein [Tsukamurella pulmonis]SUP21814.1 type I restriction enzyme EcoKI subunit R [Tsukamurella pulmonis]